MSRTKEMRLCVDDWKTVKLPDVALQFCDGPFGSNLKSSHYVDEGIRVIRLQNIGVGKLLNDDLAFISREHYKSLRRNHCEPGDVIIGTLGEPNLRACIVPDSLTESLNKADCLLLRADRNIAEPEYLCALLNSERIVKMASALIRGQTRGRISMGRLKELQIPLPPLAEQKRIAGILDAADALRTKRRESLALLDTLLQSTFLDMFGDPVNNPMGWEIKPLGELGTLDRGVSKHRPRNDPSLLEGSHPLIQTGEVASSEGYIRTYTATYSDKGLKQSKMWPAGTLCITIAANIANTGILTFGACFPDSVVGFLSDEEGRVAYVQGLFWFFRNILERKAPQSAQKNINLKILRGLPVPVPPLNLQHRFATIVASVERQKTIQRAHLAELDTLFAALQSRAFRGDL